MRKHSSISPLSLRAHLQRNISTVSTIWWLSPHRELFTASSRNMLIFSLGNHPIVEPRNHRSGAQKPQKWTQEQENHHQSDMIAARTQHGAACLKYIGYLVWDQITTAAFSSPLRGINCTRHLRRNSIWKPLGVIYICFHICMFS